MFLQAPGVSILVASENHSHKVFFALREISIGHCLANEVWLQAVILNWRGSNAMVRDFHSKHLGRKSGVHQVTTNASVF